MLHQNSHRPAATRHQQPMQGSTNPDGFLIDDEFDDYLESQVFALRESLADFHNQ